MRFAMLGPVCAWRGQDEIDLGPPQQRALLAVLLLRQGRPVMLDELVDAIWGDEPPVRAVPMLRTYASRLRKALEPDRTASRAPQVLVSVSGGYAIRLQGHTVDVARCDQHLAAARRARAEGDVDKARALLNEALADWRGVPLAGIPGPYAETERARLTELRLCGLETRLELDLELGRHEDLVAELTALVARHPLRERLRQLLMLALYRCSRQAEALAIFADTRRVLRSELGVEPGHQLRELYARILGADPSLAADPTKDSSRPKNAPRQLPMAMPGFTGREQEAERLVVALSAPSDTQARVAVVVGMGGVGKTTLALHVAHEVQQDFPGGQLYANLRGADGTPVDPHTVLGDFLRALGEVDGALPDHLDERAALFRSRLARQRVLVLLDDAQSAEQIRPLLPGCSSCAAIVTSRSQLASLPATCRLMLKVFSPGEALNLFAWIAGEHRVRAEPEATLRLLEACGGLPLAVRVVASRLATRPGWTFASLVDRLRDGRRLAQLRADDLAVEVSFQLGYTQLARAQARAFRLLAHPEVSEFGLHPAAAVLDLPPDTAEVLLEQLVDVGMLESPAVGRYRYHDLLRLFARERATEEEEPEELDAVLARLLEASLSTACEAYRLLRPGHTMPDRLVSQAPALPFANASNAWAWGEKAIPDLLTLVVQAAERHDPALTSFCADLILALDPLLEESHRWQEIIPACRAVVESAERCGDRRSEGRARYVLSSALTQVSQWVEADRHCVLGLKASSDAEDMIVLAMALNVRGITVQCLGDLGKALEYYEAAIATSRSHGDAWVEATALGNVIQRRLDAQQEIDSSLLDAVHRQLMLYRTIGDEGGEVWVLYRLGQVQRQLGQPHQAISTHRRALASSGVPRFLQAYHRLHLARALLDGGDLRLAAEEAERALSIAHQIGFDYQMAECLRVLGDAFYALDHSSQRAQACWATAEAILTRFRAPRVCQLKG